MRDDLESNAQPGRTPEKGCFHRRTSSTTGAHVAGWAAYRRPALSNERRWSAGRPMTGMLSLYGRFRSQIEADPQQPSIGLAAIAQACGEGNALLDMLSGSRLPCLCRAAGGKSSRSARRLAGPADGGKSACTRVVSMAASSIARVGAARSFQGRGQGPNSVNRDRKFLKISSNNKEVSCLKTICSKKADTGIYRLN